MLSRGSCCLIAALVVVSSSALGDQQANNDAKDLLGVWEYVLVTCESAYVDGRRPEKFVAPTGDGQYLIVLRRPGTHEKTESR